MTHRLQFQFKIKTVLVLCGMLGMLVAQADAMSRADYQASKTRIATDYKTDKAACSPQSGKEHVARAELEFGYTAKADAAYAIAKERCDDQTGNAKDVCVKEATDDKREADYKVALEKCDTSTGDAKTTCVTAAKAQFGKM